MKTIYFFNPQTQELLGSGKAEESPLEPEVPLVPLGATLLRPPVVGKRQAAVFDGEKWTLVPDWRSVPLFSITDGTPVKVDLGVLPVDAGATDKPSPGPEYAWGPGGWKYDAQRAAALFRQRQEDAVQEIISSIAQQRDVVNEDARDAKRRAAEAVLAGIATEAQVLNLLIEIQLRGMSETPQVLAEKIVTKAQAIDTLNAKLDGLKRAAENALRATTTDDELRGRITSFMGQVAAVVADVQGSES